MKTIKIEGMACEHCVAHVKEALEGLGCANINIDLASGTATVDTNEADDAIKAAIEDEGYDVVSIN